jgi:hypothetical protein
MNTCGEWMNSSTILDLSTRWRWVVSFTLRQLYLREKISRYPLDRRLGEGGRAGLDAVWKRNFSCLCRQSNPDRPTRSPSLYWLSYPGSLSSDITVGTYIMLLLLWLLTFWSMKFMQILFKSSITTSQEAYCVSIANINRLTQLSEITSHYCKNYKEHIYTLCGQNEKLFSIKASGTEVTN